MDRLEKAPLVGLLEYRKLPWKLFIVCSRRFTTLSPVVIGLDGGDTREGSDRRKVDLILALKLVLRLLSSSLYR